MSGIGNVNNSLIQSQLASLQLQQAIDTKIAAKTLDNARTQGDAALKLLDAAAQVARQTGAQPTFGQLVSGLGMNLDVEG
ncbi:MAG: hypothetical protein JW709_07150 [Sedimentisphaerales bacterium]|nr:hypothetical protein [Sedimentisphaerales bacterium]